MSRRWLAPPAAATVSAVAIGAYLAVRKLPAQPLLILLAALAGAAAAGAVLLLWPQLRRWQLPFSAGFWRIAARVWRRSTQHGIRDTAAGMAFYSLLALVPFLIVLLSVVALCLPGDEAQLRREAQRLLSQALPPSAYELAFNQVVDIFNQRRIGVLSLGALLMLWSAAELFGAVTGGLGRALGGEVRRLPWPLDRLQAFALTLISMLLIASGLVLVVAGPPLVSQLIAALGLQLDAFLAGALIEVSRWALIAGVMAGVVAVTYRAVSPPKGAPRRPVAQGTLFTVVGWLALNIGFRVFVAYFGDYNAVYGALGGVVVLLSWLYLTGLVLLLGAELNAVLGEVEPTLAS